MDDPHLNYRDLGLDVTLRDFREGQVLFSRYQLRKILGRGGMGIVWQASDLRLEREVALKFLPDTVTFNPEALENLKRETRRSLLLTHPYIIRIYDLVQDETWACISMEYIDGSTLSALKSAQPAQCFEVIEIRGWVQQFIEGLDYAHKRAKVIHRDLKPGNLMLTKEGELKIADFGISRTLTDSRGQVSSPTDSSGTLSYMSPQQARGRMPAVADDIYSLGATLYDLLTGKPPFFSGNLVFQVEEIEPPPIAERRSELGSGRSSVPPVWEQTIAACLAKDAARRPASVAEVGQRLFGTSYVVATPTPITVAPERADAPTTPVSPSVFDTSTSTVPRGPSLWRRMLGPIWTLFCLVLLVLAAWEAWRLGGQMVREQEAKPPTPSADVQAPAQQDIPAKVETPVAPTPPPPAPAAVVTPSVSPAPTPPAPSAPPTPSQTQVFQAGDYACVSGGTGDLSVTGPFPADDNRQTWVFTGTSNGTWTTGPIANHPQLAGLPKDAILPRDWTYGLTTLGEVIMVRQLNDQLILLQPRQTTDQWNRTVYSTQGAMEKIFQKKPAVSP